MKRNVPLTYYYPTGPLGQVIAAMSKVKPLPEIGAIGLGTGSIAGYGKAGQHITFYEINPAVKEIAEDPKLFTYLTDARARKADVQVVLGDARLTLACAPPGRYDLLVLDAYSSDSIPMHLVTRQAIELYLKKLAPHGILALHITNRYFHLEPVVGRLAQDARLASRIQKEEKRQISKAEKDEGKWRSHWVIMANQDADLLSLAHDPRWTTINVPAGTPLWTDDFSNIVGVLTWWDELDPLRNWWHGRSDKVTR